MIIILGVLLLLSLFFNIWFWDHYMGSPQNSEKIVR